MNLRIWGTILTLTMSIGLAPAEAASAAVYENSSKTETICEDSTELEANYAKLVTVKYSEIENMAGTAKDLVDSGTVLLITNPEISAEAISELLSIPKSNTTSYQKEILMAYSICKVKDQYIFTNHYAVMASETTTDLAAKNFLDIDTEEMDAPTDQPQTNFSNAILMAEPFSHKNSDMLAFNTTHMASAVLSCKADMEAFTSSVSETKNMDDSGILPYSCELPGITATNTWNDILYVYGSDSDNYYGYLNCTVYAYEKGTGMVNDSLQNIYDVISVVKAYPQGHYRVKRYETQIHCNISDFSCLQTTSLNSGINYSQGLSLTGSFKTDDIGGEVNYSTQWNYNPESQTITESSSYPRVVNWKAEPYNSKAGTAYDIAPGMRVAAPTQYMRGAFSKIYCDAMIWGITINANEIQVGGWF